MRHPLSAALVALILVAIAPAAHAQRGAPQPDERLVPLGEEIAKFQRETDTFLIGPDKGRFSSLVFAAERANIRVVEVKVGFANGESETIAVGQSTSPQRNAIVVDLPGRGRRITTVDATYRTVPGEKRRAIVALSGRRFVPPPLKFELVAQERFSLRQRELSVSVGRRAGRLDAIRVAAIGRDVFVREIIVIFGDGTEKVFPTNDWLSVDRPTPPLLLDRRGRFVDRVSLRIRPRRGRRRAGIEVLGHQARPSSSRARLSASPQLDANGEPRGFDRVTRIRLGDRTTPMRIPIGRRVGLIRALVLRTTDNGARVRQVRVIYGNGQTDPIEIGARMGRGDVSRVIDFGPPRFVREVEIVARSRRRGPSATLELYADLAGNRSPSPRRRPQGRSRERQLGWTLLASRTPPMFQPTTEVIKVGRNAGRLRALRLTIKRHDVHIYRLEVLYPNGKTQIIPVSDKIAYGTTTKEFTLDGRFVQDIKVRYKTSVNLNGEGLVEIWGLK